jgi:sec-independent protein translocase protein TatB
VFGVNLPEFSVLVLVALIVVGPERLPRYAQQLGRFVREGRRMAMGLREQVREELGPEFDDVDWRKLDPRQYDPRRIVREALSDVWEDEDPPASPPAPPSGATAATDEQLADLAEPGPVSLQKPPQTPPEAPFDPEAT